MKLMENTEKIVIDPSKEMTMKEYAKHLGKPYTTVATWVQRRQISFRVIPELNDLILIQIGTEKKS